MGQLRSVLLAFVLVLPGTIWPGVSASAADTSDDAACPKDHRVCFRWAFGAMVGPEDDRRLVSISRDTMLKTGDELKMLVDLQKPCFVYVIYYSSQGEVGLLFPGEAKQVAATSETSITYHIPDGEAWFKLDECLSKYEQAVIKVELMQMIEAETIMDKRRMEEQKEGNSIS